MTARKGWSKGLTKYTNSSVLNGSNNRQKIINNKNYKQMTKEKVAQVGITKLFTIVGIMLMTCFMLYGVFVMADDEISSQPITTYTSSTKTVCQDGVCNKILYSGTRFVEEDDQWKKIEDAMSLKDNGFLVKYLEMDEDFYLEVMDFNMTDIELRAVFKGDPSDYPAFCVVKTPDVEFKCQFKNTIKWEEWNDVSQEFDKYEMKYDLKYEMKNSIMVANNTKFSYKGDVFGKSFKFGGNSTTVTLQDADTDNLRDTYVILSNPDTNYGTSNTLFTRGGSSAKGESWMNWNISDIDISGSTNNNTRLFLWQFDGRLGDINNIVTINKGGDNWNETGLTYNNKPAYGEEVDNFTTTSDTDGWFDFDITDYVNEKLLEGANNISLVVTNYNSVTTPIDVNEYHKFYSKERITVSQRPYLIVTFNFSAPILSSVSESTDPIRTGEIQTITANSVADTDNDTLYFYCGKSTEPNKDTTICTGGTTSDTGAPYSLTCTYIEMLGDTDSEDVFCRVWDGISYSNEETTSYDIFENPTYSLSGHNNTVVGIPTLFSILYNDDTSLYPNGQYIFSTNNTGTWTNNSAVNFTTTPSWANVTKLLNSTVDLVIGYRWYTEDNDGNINNTEIFTLTTTDTISPTVNILIPESETYATNESLELNFTATDNVVVDKCWYNLINSTGSILTSNTTIVSCLNTTFNVSQGDGTYDITVFSNDTSGNEGSDTVTFSISTDSPAINLDYPTDNIYLDNGDNIYFNFTATDTDGLSECQLWGNWTGNWTNNYTWINPPNATQNYTILNISNTNAIWNIWCNDSVGNGGFSSSNYTITIDTTYPQPIINSITTTTDSKTFWFNHTTTDTNINTCKYSIFDSTGGIDGANENVSFTCGTNLRENATATDYAVYNLTIYAVDLAGNENSTTTSFTISESVSTPTGGGGGTTIIEANLTGYQLGDGVCESEKGETFFNSPDDCAQEFYFPNLDEALFFCIDDDKSTECVWSTNPGLFIVLFFMLAVLIISILFEFKPQAKGINKWTFKPKKKFSRWKR